MYLSSIKKQRFNMKLRKLTKMCKPNDGNRSFYESILNIHVLTALKYLSHNKVEFIIIGELATSFHTKPYQSKTIRILVKDKNIKFKYFKNNYCRGIKLDILDLNDINITIEQYELALKTCYISDSFKIASPTFLMSIFIKNLDLHNSSDAYRLTTNCAINTNELFCNLNDYQHFIYKVNKDYTMKYVNNFKDYFKCKIYEGTSGYPEVDNTFNDWINNTEDINQVLIGGMALVNYDIDRTTTDVDFLFLSKEEIPTDVYGFKHHRKSAFQHNKTHVEVEVVTGNTINISNEFVEKIFDTAYDKGKFKIASPSAIIAIKLGRFNEVDKEDIVNLYKNYNINIDVFKPYLSKEEINNYNNLIKNI